MINPYQKIRDGKKAGEVLLAAATASEVEMKAALDALSADFVETDLEKWSLDSISRNQTQCFLYTGGIFYLYREATETKGWTGCFTELRKKTGYNKTKAYASIVAFRHLGRPIFERPVLAQRFNMASLLVLTGKGSSDEAREQALSLAEGGQMITAKLAKQLVKESQEPIEVSPVVATSEAESPVESEGHAEAAAAPQELFSHTGSLVRFVVEAGTAVSLSNALVQHELDEAIDRLRRACEAANHSVNGEACRV